MKKMDIVESLAGRVRIYESKSSCTWGYNSQRSFFGFIESGGLRRNILLIILMFFVSTGTFAQIQIGYEFQQIRDNLLKNDHLSILINYDMFANDTSQIILETQQARFYKEGQIQMVDFMGANTWYTPDETISIIKDEKKVVLADAVTGFESMFLPGITLDSIMALFDIQRKTDAKTSNIIYQIHIPVNIAGPYKRIDVEVNKNHFYEKITMWCRFPLSYYGKCSECDQDLPRVELSFVYNTNTQSNSELKQFLSCLGKSEQGYYLTGPYKQYEIVNLKHIQ